VISQNTTLNQEELARFEKDLKTTIENRMDWLKFQRVVDQCDGDALVVFQRGSDKRIIKKITKDQLDHRTVDEILNSLRTMTSPIGCN
jgi:hypothetical protein